jgi:hypothetical protein
VDDGKEIVNSGAGAAGGLPVAPVLINNIARIGSFSQQGQLQRSYPCLPQIVPHAAGNHETAAVRHARSADFGGHGCIEERLWDEAKRSLILVIHGRKALGK